MILCRRIWAALLFSLHKVKREESVDDIFSKQDSTMNDVSNNMRLQLFCLNMLLIESQIVADDGIYTVHARICIET